MTFESFLQAVEEGRTEKVKAYLELHPDAIDSLNFFGKTPLHVAAEWGHKSIVEQLLQAGSQALDFRIESNGQTALHCAAMGGHESIVELLLQTGSQSLNVPDKCGRTPLYWALKCEQKSETVQILKAIGASMELNLDKIKFKLNLRQLEVLREPISKEEVVAIRFRINPNHSFLSALLLFL